MTLKLIHKVCKASALAVIFLQAQRSCAISYFIPIAFMSLLTHGYFHICFRNFSFSFSFCFSTLLYLCFICIFWTNERMNKIKIKIKQLLHVFIRALLPTTPVTFILVNECDPIILFLLLNMPKPYQSCSLDLFLDKRLNNSSRRFLSFNDTPHAHTSYTIILSALFNLFMQVLHIHSPHLDTIYQHSLKFEHRHHICFYSFSKRCPFLSKLVLAH